jgi:hypothetical protein
LFALGEGPYWYLGDVHRQITAINGWSPRDLCRSLEGPGAKGLREAHAAPRSAVRAAYGMKDAQ